VGRPSAAADADADAEIDGGGLPGREPGAEPVGVPAMGEPGRLAKALFLGLPPRSVPDASVSLPEPAARARARASGDIGRVPSTAGDMAREEDAEAWVSFLSLFLLDSLPLASERLGEPGRLREEPAAWLRASPCFSARPEGVFVPVDAPDGGLSPSSLSSLSSLFFLSSSFCRSVSESSDSLCTMISGCYGKVPSQWCLPLPNKDGHSPTRIRIFALA